MTAESGLKWLLRFICATTCLALVGAVMPQSWLAYLVNKAEPGASTGILMTYLARMLCAMYAMVGLQCFIFATDVRRYLSLIWILGVGSLIIAPLGLTLLFSMAPPGQRTGLFWVVFGDLTEGFVQGALLVVLLLRIRHTDAQ